MKLTDGSIGTTQLRVFHNETEDEPRQGFDSVSQQLPFLNALVQQFESVTGWTIAFHEMGCGLSLKDRGDLRIPIVGRLQITDMSASVVPGKPASHRVFCDQLVETLDAMIQMIQSSRQQFSNVVHRLNPVVELPFEWWGIGGNSGFSDGSFSSWSVSSEEKIRGFFGRLNTHNAVDSALAASIVLSTFETASQTGMALPEIAPILPTVLQRSDQLSAHLNSFVTVELDPITGEFEIDGYNASSGLAMIDVAAATAFALCEDDKMMLYSGQILAIGIGPAELDRINSLLRQQELSVEHCLQILNQEFSQAAAIFLYRK